jgi:hypothetical protein
LQKSPHPLILASFFYLQPVHEGLQRLGAQIGDDKDFLHVALSPGLQFVSAGNRHSDFDFKRGRSPLDPRQPARCDGFNAWLPGQAGQNRNQPRQVRGVIPDEAT